MKDPIIAKLQDWLRSKETDLLNHYRELLRIPSIETEASPNAPFGQANRQALDFVLKLGAEWGMQTKDGEGYWGYAEFGSGKKLITTFGHLDVVPVGPGWKHEPFGAEIDDGYVYARGAIDDKGPTIAAFYAAKAIYEICPELSVRIRTWFGCDEESGFECIKHYSAREEVPTFGIAPDSGWPLYHAEKGIANIVIEAPLITGDLALTHIAGGQRPNIVIDSCEAVVQISRASRSELESKLADAWDRNLEWSWSDSSSLSITSKGKAAHGSWPHGGDSAAIRLFRFLYEIAPISCKKAYETLFQMTHIGGAGLGIAGADGGLNDLTCNLGIVKVSNGNIQLTFNIRYPVTWKGEDVRQKCEIFLRDLDGDYRITNFSDSSPLYFPLEHPLVQTICKAYEEETGEQKKPGIMGGGTYARAIANTVSIGTGWDGDGMAHETDERLKIEHLFKMSRIYVHILYRLALLAGHTDQEHALSASVVG